MSRRLVEERVDGSELSYILIHMRVPIRLVTRAHVRYI